MSRISKQPIPIPAGVSVSRSADMITITGAKGSLTREFKKDIAIEITDSEIQVSDELHTIFTKALVGTYAAHIKNMITGVTSGYEKKLILEGVGFKVAVNGTDIDMSLGFSHPVKVATPSNLSVTAEKNLITVSGIDKDVVGQFAAYLRSLKKPEPYKGKGMRYEKEIIRRKEGKKNA
jgi:large subunit ribosomal protein L6